PASGPGPVIRADRKADGTIAVQDPCCTIVQRWLGDHTNPILKPEAARAVEKFADLSFSGTVAPDLHNTCWPEPPPYVMGLHFGMQIVQLRDEVTLLYLLYNTVRHVRLNAAHPENVTPSWQGHSVGWYEGETLVIDTVGIKVAPLSTVDAFGTPHSKALHVVERYRLIDGEAAAEAQRKHGAIYRPAPPYGRGTIDPGPAKKGLQIEFTVDDEGVFTTPWSGACYLPAPHRHLAGSGLRRKPVFFRRRCRDAHGTRVGFLSCPFKNPACPHAEGLRPYDEMKTCCQRRRFPGKRRG